MTFERVVEKYLSRNNIHRCSDYNSTVSIIDHLQVLNTDYGITEIYGVISLEEIYL